MGDSTSVSLTLAGRFETVIALKAVCEALEGDHLQFDWGARTGDADTFATAIGEAVAAGEKTISFYADDVNYGNLDEVEAACEEHGVAFSYSWDAGQGYPAGVKAFVPGRETITTASDGDHATVDLEALQKALKAADPLPAIRKLVEDAEIADGQRLPPLSISEAVKAFIASDVSLVDVDEDTADHPHRVGHRVAENTHANVGFYVRPDDNDSFSPATVYPTAADAWAAFDAEQEG